MSKLIRQSIVSSLLSYLGVLVGYFNIIWFFPYVFSTEQLGLVRVVQDMALLMTPFAQAGLRQSLLRFYPRFEAKGEKTSFLSFIFLGGVLSYVIFFIGFELFRPYIMDLFEERSAMLVEYVHVVLFMVFILVITGLFEGYGQMLFKVSVPNFIREVLLRLFLTILTFCYFKQIITYDLLVNLIAGAYLLAFLLLFIYFIYLKVIPFQFKIEFPERRLFREIIRYGSIVVLGSSGSLLVAKVDSLMVASMLGISEAGIYTTMFNVAVVIEMPRRALAQLTAPIVSTAFQQVKIRKIKALYQIISINQLALGTLLFIGIWANLDSLFYMMPKGDEFRAGKYVVLLIGISKLLDMATSINSDIISMSKFYRFNLYGVSIIGLLTVVANIIFIPIYGLNGAALASLLTLGIYNFIKLIFIYFKFKMQPFGFNTIKILIIGALAYYLSTLIPRHPLALVDVGIRSALITLIYVPLIIALKVSPDVNRFYHLLVSKLLHFVRK
ncbi:lipopolysaccharide biosynthesis protein [Xanthovirga aplysinae]|uniref:lipopolysaccharide biosynthesis protein n=1 Tax=Xanthovirga aplysinae TaxID=2529853 RepID=UPI0012BD46D7|nr:oligosaccharide flippase family protein [Xanthovirga aplysinae]MTI29721.1 hypothetical protein [Xanthovirga aplysinae]